MSGLSPAFQALQDDSFVGTVMASMLYGAYLCLALCNIYHLARSGRRILLGYTITLLCITTVYMGVALNYAQKQLIDDPTTPDLLSVWPQVVVDSAYSINTWLTDAYLLYRCFIVWSGDFQIVILFVPILVYLGSVATSITLLIFTANPGASYSSHLVQVFGTANWSLSLALNAIVTILIATRLLWYRSRVRKALGNGHGQVYMSILAISIESAALYAAFELIVLVTFLTNSATENTFFPMTGNIQVIVPNLIILRIAKGKSFTTKATIETAMSHIVFAPFEKSPDTSIGSSTQAEGKGLKQSRSTLLAKEEELQTV
ncbi:hypothetical protein ACEPAF_1549 [Sanghuangporus sanghuang]